MTKKRMADDGSWKSLLFCAALPAGLAAAMVIAMALSGCKREVEAPDQWIGVDRALVVWRCAALDVQQTKCCDQPVVRE